MASAPYYGSSEIIIFPAGNATGTGRHLSEENVRDIVTRITSRNYILASDSLTVTPTGSGVTIGVGTANIQGYLITTTAPMTVTKPVSDGSYVVGLKINYEPATTHIIWLDTVDNTKVAGVEAGYYDRVTAEASDDYLILSYASISGGVVTYTNNILNQIKIETSVNSTYSTYATFIGNETNYYTINQNLRITDDVVFNKVTAGAIVYGSTDLATKITSIEGVNTTQGNNITSLQNDKLNSSEVVASAAANKVLRLNGDSKLPADITGTAANATLAASATKLATARTLSVSGAISGTVSFDGSADADIAVASLDATKLSGTASVGTTGNAGTATKLATTRAFKIGSTARNFDGSAALTWTLGDIGAAAASHGTHVTTSTAVTSFNGSTGAVTANYAASASVGGPASTLAIATSTAKQFILGSASSGSAVKYNTTVYFTNGVLTANTLEAATISSSGAITATGNITGAKVYNAVYNDYAEWMERDNLDEVIEPGDVIEINPETGRYRKSTSRKSKYVVGVCSNSYGHILGGDKLEDMEDNIKEFIPIGLSGRVYVKIDERAMIGDLLVSGEDGKAEVLYNRTESRGIVIGKALSPTINGKVLMQIMLV